MDRRAIVFLCMAAAAGLLVPVTPSGLEYVGVIMCIWFVVLAGASWVDLWDRLRQRDYLTSDDERARRHRRKSHAEAERAR